MSEPKDPKLHSQDRFGQFAERYVSSATHAKAPELARLVEIADPQPDWLALDIATGGGHTALAFAQYLAQVIVTDLTAAMLAEARQFLLSQGVRNAAFTRADAENIPLDANTFDLVTCRIAPHHFPDPACFVRAAARVLKPGGLLLVQDHLLPPDPADGAYIDDFERLRDPSHVRGFSQIEWEAMFTRAGLTVGQTETVIKRHTLDPWADRQNCSPQVKSELLRRLQSAPPAAQAWLDPLALGTDQASFCNRHLIIAGVKV